MQDKDHIFLKCRNCGKAIRWDNSFCSACGSRTELTGGATINIPSLNEQINKRELCGNLLTPEATVETESVGSSSSPASVQKRTPKVKRHTSRNHDNFKSLDSRWRRAWLTYRIASAQRPILLLLCVLAELFMFLPYVLMVLYVFQYQSFCAWLAISGASVLLTHGVCVGLSYCSVLNKMRKSEYGELGQAVENTQRWLKGGAVLISAFLLAFFICLTYDSVADAPQKSATVYVPASFDD